MAADTICYERSCGHREWNNEEIKELIGLYKKQEILYNVSSKGYYDRGLRRNALELIAAKFPNCTAFDVSRKWKNLCTQFNTHHKKAREKNGRGSADVEVKWRFYQAMKFMEMYIIQRKSKSTPLLPGNNILKPDDEPAVVEPAPQIKGEVDPEESVSFSREQFQETYYTYYNTPSTSSQELISLPDVPPSCDSGGPRMTQDGTSKRGKEDAMFEDLLKVMRQIADKRLDTSNAENDECSRFGCFVADELREIKDPNVRKKLRSAICATIFNWET